VSSATAHVRVLMDKVPEFTDAMRQVADRNVAKAALDIEARAKGSIQSQGLIDTGNLLNSVQARRLGSMRWLVEVGAHYGIYLEMGTRFMPARPYLFPAAEYVRPSFYAAMRAL
jgi:HK97 gp10 family phage protein